MLFFLLIPFIAALALAYYATAPRYERYQIIKLFRYCMEVFKRLSNAKFVNDRARAAMPDLFRGSQELREIWIGVYTVQATMLMAELRSWYSGLALQCPFDTLEDLPAEYWKLIAGAARNNVRHLIIEHTEYTNAREAIVANKAMKKRRKAS